MPTDNNALHPPSHDAIRKQVKLVLDSARFRNATNQADVLNYVVEAWLSGNIITEDRIGFAIFPKYIADQSTDVRKTIGNLRKSLTSYCEQEGAEDLVHIQMPKASGNRGVKLPPGEAYRPVASFNPRHSANVEFSVGETFGRRGDKSDLELAVTYYQRALALYPEHVDAIISLGRTLCDFYLLEKDLAVRQQIEAQIDRATELAPEYWRTHTLRGLFFDRAGSVEKAKRAYKKAFALNARCTGEDFHYQLFLRRAGRLQEAILLAAQTADAEPNSAHKAAIYGGFLIMDKQMEKAEKLLRYALRLDRNCIYARMYQAIMCEVYERADELAIHLKHLEASLDKETFEKLLETIKN